MLSCNYMLLANRGGSAVTLACNSPLPVIREWRHSYSRTAPYRRLCTSSAIAQRASRVAVHRITAPFAIVMHLQTWREKAVLESLPSQGLYGSAGIHTLVSVHSPSETLLYFDKPLQHPGQQQEHRGQIHGGSARNALPVISS